MRYLENPSTNPHFNLAFDEYCLKNLPLGEEFFYLWRNCPSVIIGLNQNAYSEVNLDYLRSHDINLARRVTGGGAVYHDLQNLNYSFVGEDVSPQIIANALKSMGVRAELSGRNDIFVKGRKVSGYARRLYQNRALVHGTLMYDVDIQTLTSVLNTPASKLNAKGVSSVSSRVANLKEYFSESYSIDNLKFDLQQSLAGGDSEYKFTQSELLEIQKIADEKFATWEWVYAQSHKADMVQTYNLPCGTLELSVSVDKGIIRELNFGGDYLFEYSTDVLKYQLLGTRFESLEAIVQQFESFVKV